MGSKRPVHDKKNAVYAVKKLELMMFRLTQERGSWPYLMARLEIVGEKLKETARLVWRHNRKREKRSADSG